MRQVLFGGGGGGGAKLSYYNILSSSCPKIATISLRGCWIQVPRLVLGQKSGIKYFDTLTSCIYWYMNIKAAHDCFNCHLYMYRIRAPVFGRHQFSAPQSITEKHMEIYYLDE